MSRPLPLRANLEWLKKLCKERLAALRADRPKATLSESQRDVAREYGFPSWRKLKEHVEQHRARLDAVASPERLRAAAAEVVAPDDADLTRLLSAVDDGDAVVVADLLARRPALARAHGPDGRTALHAAAQCNDPQLAATLMVYGADPEAKFGESGHTALSWAVTCNAPECARTLVRLGAKLDLFSAAGLGAIEHVRACFDTSGSLVAGASRTGSSRFAPDGTRRPCPPPTAREQVSDALCNACRNGQVEVARLLLGKDPDLSFHAYLGASALHWAYFGGSRAIVELLERAGADASARDDAYGCTPRGFGVCAPAAWGLAFLVRDRLAADPSLVNFMDGRTSPLHEAARSGSVEVVRLLLDHGADPSLLDSDGAVPLDLATDRGHAEVAELLRTAIRPNRDA